MFVLYLPLQFDTATAQMKPAISELICRVATVQQQQGIQMEFCRRGTICQLFIVTHECNDNQAGACCRVPLRVGD